MAEQTPWPGHGATHDRPTPMIANPPLEIREIAFLSYKPYGGPNVSELQRLKLAPLTLVFGKNNSGKSAAVRLPRLLLGGIERADGQLLQLDVRGLRYGQGFFDLVYGGAFFERPTFQVVAEFKGQRLDFMTTLFSPSALAADQPPQVWSYEMRAPRAISLSGPPKEGDLQLRFTGLLPPQAEWNAWREAARDALEAMVHIGPTRPQIAASYANEQVAGFGPHGLEAPQLLRINSALADEVSRWYETFMDGARLSLKRDSDSFSLRIGRSKSLSSNLAQGGEGLQQVLPVVVHQFLRQRHDRGPFLDVVEQPELHLHAAAQAPLADLFIDTALQGRGQMLVETNSEPILLRVQRRVAEGRLRPDQLAIYYVETVEDGSRLRPVDVNAEGELEWWPAGVFEEDFREVVAIRRAQRSHGTPKASP
jgi:hypothetical protein